MKYLQIHVLIVFLPFMLLDAIEDALPFLIMLSGKKIQENETTIYQLNCSSVWNPLGKSAEFIVNGKTVDHLSVFNDTCSNSKGKECNVNVINNCYCIPDKNIFIIKLSERNIDENIFSCQMRFKDARNENIIRAYVSIAFNGSEDELYEYDIKFVGNKAEDENKNITNFKEHSENLEVWLPVGFSISLIVLPIVTILLCFCRRKYCRKSAKTTKKEKESIESPAEELYMKTSKPLIDKTLDDDSLHAKLTMRKGLRKILEDLHFMIQNHQIDEELHEVCNVERHELLKVLHLVTDLYMETTETLLGLSHDLDMVPKEILLEWRHDTVWRREKKARTHKQILEILEILGDRHKKIIMSFWRGELYLDYLDHERYYWEHERLHVRDKFGKTPLMIAISKEDIQKVDLLTKVRDYTYYSKDTDLSGNTVVHWACAAKENEIIRLIIDRRYDINKPNNYKVSPLMVACSKGHLTAAKLLIKATADYNAKDIHDTTVFHCACAGGNVDIIDLLIKKGCDIHKPNESGITPLMVACSKCHLSIVQRLIEHNVNVNENDLKGNSVFFWACTGGNIEVIKLVIEKSSEINKPNDYKITPLMVACLYGNFKLYQLLINNGAKHNAIDAMGDTVFHYSCAGGNNEIIDSLIKKGCEIDKPNNSMITPLMVACGKGNLSAVIRLILSGANYNACDLKGRTVLHWSFATGNNAISELIVAVSDKQFPYENLKQNVMNRIATAHQNITETDFRDLIGTSQLYWSCFKNLPF